MAQQSHAVREWCGVVAAATALILNSCDNRTTEARGYDRLGISIHDSTSEQGAGVTPAPKSTLPRTEPVPRPELGGEVPLYHEHKDDEAREQ
ncbi:MAG: hypothetical protein H0U23_02735 [Blastocatellia bacterium]|nr:hypothetical protein [Blastocatellia bacterium]